MSERDYYKLKDVTTKIGSGSTPTGGGESYKEEGVALIRSQNILDLNFSVDGLAFIDDNQAYALRSVAVQEEDVLLNITGDSVARVCMVPSKILPARVNQHVSIIRANQEKLLSKYLLYSLIAQKETLLTLSEIGATRRALTKTMLEELEIATPPFSEQQSIAEVLSSLDDKIDLLHQQNKTLETLAETLFRQWFVEEVEILNEEIILSEIATHEKQSISPTSFPQEIFYHYSLPAFDNGRKPEIQHGIDILSNKYCIKSGHILISKLNPRTPRVWYIISCRENSICSTEFQVYQAKDQLYSEFIYCMLKSNETRDILAGASSGTSGSHQRVNPSDISNLSIKKPDIQKLEKFHSISAEWLMKVSINHKSIQALETLRDNLLPKLMSGAITVNSE